MAPTSRGARARGQPLFTLSGGHLFSIYDGCKAEGIGVIDTRHEQAAAFAADGLRQGDSQARASRR